MTPPTIISGRLWAAVVAGVAVVAFVVLGLAIPEGRPPAIDDRVDQVTAEMALELAQVHQNQPVMRRLVKTYDVRPFQEGQDPKPPRCDIEDAREAIVVTARGFWFLPIARTLVGCGGMSSL